MLGRAGREAPGSGSDPSSSPSLAYLRFLEEERVSMKAEGRSLSRWHLKQMRGTSVPCGAGRGCHRGVGYLHEFLVSAAHPVRNAMGQAAHQEGMDGCGEDG